MSRSAASAKAWLTSVPAASANEVVASGRIRTIARAGMSRVMTAAIVEVGTEGALVTSCSKLILPRSRAHRPEYLYADTPDSFSCKTQQFALQPQGQRRDFVKEERMPSAVSKSPLSTTAPKDPLTGRTSPIPASFRATRHSSPPPTASLYGAGVGSCAHDLLPVPLPLINTVAAVVTR